MWSNLAGGPAASCTRRSPRASSTRPPRASSASLGPGHAVSHATSGRQRRDGRSRVVAALQRPFDTAERLHLLERHPHRDAPDSTRAGNDARSVRAHARKRQRSGDFNAARCGAPCWLRRIRDDAVEQFGGERAGCPPGRTARSCRPVDPASPRRRCRPARSTSRRHHPRRRQSSGSTIRTACTRPGRIVSAGERDEAAAKPQAVVGPRDRQAVFLVEAAPDSGRHGEQPGSAATCDADDRAGRQHRGDDEAGDHELRQEADVADQDRRHELRVGTVARTSSAAPRSEARRARPHARVRAGAPAAARPPSPSDRRGGCRRRRCRPSAIAARRRGTSAPDRAGRCRSPAPARGGSATTGGAARPSRSEGRRPRSASASRATARTRGGRRLR